MGTFPMPDFGGGSGNNSMGIGSLRTGGSNQYMDFPTFSTPLYNGGTVGSAPSFANNPDFFKQAGGTYRYPTGNYSNPTLDPGLTGQYGNWLQGLIGRGATPYSGPLSAPINPLMQGLGQDFMSGNLPLSGQFNNVLGDALSGGQALPVWQSMIQAMQKPISDQYANIKESFGSQGALGSSEMGNSLTTFGSDVAAQQNSMLGQLMMSEQGQLGNLALGIGGLGQQDLQNMMSFAQSLQGLDQNAVQAQYQEFLRTSPEYSPYLPLISQLATTFPGSAGPQQASNGSSLFGSIGSTVAGLLPMFGL